MKKVVFTTVLIIFCSISYSAQQEEKSSEKEVRIPVTSKLVGSVRINSIPGELTVDTHMGEEIIIRCRGNFEHTERSERAEGLRYIGSDNTGIGLSVSEDEKSVTITGVMNIEVLFFKGTESDYNYTVTVPERMAVRINQGPPSPGSDFIKVKNSKKELEIKAFNTDIFLENITGPAIISTVKGNIEGSFSELNQANPSSISAVSGHIDLSLPAGSRASLEISTISGRAYTDFDFEHEREGPQNIKRIGGGNIKGNINNGGVQMLLKTISGDVYLRKR